MQHREGAVQVECAVQLAAGHNKTKDCVVLGGSPEPEFREVALNYVAHNQYAPAIRNGVPVEERRSWTVAFKLLPPAEPDERVPAGMVLPRETAGSQLFYPEAMRRTGQRGVVQVECIIGVDGATRQCRILNGAGGELFYYWALDRALHAVFAPALLHGVPVEFKHRWTMGFGLRKTDEDPPVLLPPPPLPPVPPPLTIPFHAAPLYGDSRDEIEWLSFETVHPSGSGSFTLSCLVTVDGRPTDCTIVVGSGNAANDAMVLARIVEQRFGPPLRDGLPIQTRATWRVQYNSHSASMSGLSDDPA